MPFGVQPSTVLEHRSRCAHKHEASGKRLKKNTALLQSKASNCPTSRRPAATCAAGRACRDAAVIPCTSGRSPSPSMLNLLERDRELSVQAHALERGPAPAHNEQRRRLVAASCWNDRNHANSRSVYPWRATAMMAAAAVAITAASPSAPARNSPRACGRRINAVVIDCGRRRRAEAPCN